MAWEEVKEYVKSVFGEDAKIVGFKLWVDVGGTIVEFEAMGEGMKDKKE